MCKRSKIRSVSNNLSKTTEICRVKQTLTAWKSLTDTHIIYAFWNIYTTENVIKIQICSKYITRKKSI